MLMLMFPPSIQDRCGNVRAIFICLLLMIPCGCTRNYDGGWNVPLVHKIDIQQGNVIDQSMIDKLKQGMDKTQVRFIMGTPVLVDPFHNNRWDYIYSFQRGSRQREQRHISLYFEDEKLAYIKGDVQTSLIQHATDDLKEGESVVVPLAYKKEKGVFGRIIDKLNPWSDESPPDRESEQTDVNTQGDDSSDGELE